MYQTPKHTAPPTNSQAAAYGYKHAGSMASHGVAWRHTVTEHKHSFSWITDGTGNANQYLAYLPFGEQFIDQRKTKHSKSKGKNGFFAANYYGNIFDGGQNVNGYAKTSNGKNVHFSLPMWEVFDISFSGATLKSCYYGNTPVTHKVTNGTLFKNGFQDIYNLHFPLYLRLNGEFKRQGNFIISTPLKNALLLENSY